MPNSIADEIRFVFSEQVVIYKHITIPEIERESIARLSGKARGQSGKVCVSLIQEIRHC